MFIAPKSLSLVMLSLFAVATAACSAAPPEDSANESEDALGARSGSDSAPSTPLSSSAIPAGKYMSNGNMLMIYGRCSDENFLGPAAGALGADGRTISVEEGNVCGSYKLTPVSLGVVDVSWIKPAESHLGLDVEDNCRSLEGKYAMTVSSPYKDIAPGQYKHGATTLTVEPGCNTPSKLGTARGVIAPESISGQSKPVFHVEEGNICGTYVLEQKGNDVLVTYEKPEGAHLGADVETSCASVAGLYKK